MPRRRGAGAEEAAGQGLPTIVEDAREARRAELRRAGERARAERPGLGGSAHGRVLTSTACQGRTMPLGVIIDAGSKDEDDRDNLWLHS